MYPKTMYVILLFNNFIFSSLFDVKSVDTANLFLKCWIRYLSLNVHLTSEDIYIYILYIYIGYINFKNFMVLETGLLYFKLR